MNYDEFIKQKALQVEPSGIQRKPDDLHPALFPFQRALNLRTLAHGKFCNGANTGLGKALKNGTPVLTPTGWVPIENLKVDDLVVGSDGCSTFVQGVFPQGVRPIYRIHFSDGCFVDCDESHLWQVQSSTHRYKGHPGKVVSTQWLLDRQSNATTRTRKFFIPVVKPVYFPEKELPIDPYTLGVLLGDGGIKYNHIDVTTDDWVAQKMAIHPDCKLSQKEEISKGVSTYSLVLKERSNQKGSNPMKSRLLDLGLMGKGACEKFIPSAYLFSSVGQRIKLLQGLLDTDGSPTLSGLSEYATSSNQLAFDVQHLVQSLGGTARIGVKESPMYTYKGEKRTGQTAYRLTIKLPSYIDPFTLPRKVAAQTKTIQRKEPYRTIERIEPLEMAEATCISVDSTDRLFVTENFIVTHNTLMQLDCCNQLVKHTDRAALIIAPLAVSHQTEREAARWNIKAKVIFEQSDIEGAGIYITNYQKLERFNLDDFSTICLDEGSAIKNDSGKWSKLIRQIAQDKPFRLSYSATFAPNDFTELGMQSEFLGLLSESEMKSMFFTHDGHDQKGAWQLKGHAKSTAFWEWLSSWCALVRRPSDIGDYDDTGYELPGLKVHEHKVKGEVAPPDGMLEGMWIPTGAIADKRHINKSSIEQRCEYAANLADSNDEQWVIWVNTADESKQVTRMIQGAVEVKGSDTDEHKISSIAKFQSGEIRVIVTKDSIFGFGINLQNCCHSIVFPNDSFERYYQLVRRFYRFGQKRIVHIHRVYHELESWTTMQNVARKSKDSDRMFEQLKTFQLQRFQSIHKGIAKVQTGYNPTKTMLLPNWLLPESNQANAA